MQTVNLHKSLIPKWNHLDCNGLTFPTEFLRRTLLDCFGPNFCRAGYKKGYKGQVAQRDGKGAFRSREEPDSDFRVCYTRTIFRLQFCRTLKTLLTAMPWISQEYVQDLFRKIPRLKTDSRLCNFRPIIGLLRHHGAGKYLG